MVVQVVLDSLSRCFGAPGQTHPGTRSQGVDVNSQNAQNMGVSRPEATDNLRRKSNYRYGDDGEALDSRRRQGKALGLELHDHEWDALFSGETRPKTDERGIEEIAMQGKQHRVTTKKLPDMDIEYADVIAKAREAARPSRHVTPKKIDKKAEIFRPRSSPNTSFASRFLGNETVIKALCFANPVHDCAQGDIENISIADTHGAQTAEDTITSTLYFESKFNGIMETRPPMPLFNRYKVECSNNNTNSLIGIVNSGSHHSIHMLKDFEDHAKEQSNPLIGGNDCVVSHDLGGYDDSDAEEDGHVGNGQQKNVDMRNVLYYDMQKAKISEGKKAGKSLNDVDCSEYPPSVQAVSDNSMSTTPSCRSNDNDVKRTYQQSTPSRIHAVL